MDADLDRDQPEDGPYGKFIGGRAIMKGGRTFEIKTPMGVGARSKCRYRKMSRSRFR